MTYAAVPTMTDPGRAASHASLLDLVSAHHGYVPCRRRDDVPQEWWTADDDDMQAAAAAACAWCPAAVALVCQAYGLDHPREAGVYGSLTEGQRHRHAGISR